MNITLNVNRAIGLLWFDFNGVYTWTDEKGRVLKTSGSVIYANQGTNSPKQFDLQEYVAILTEIAYLIDRILSNTYSDEELLQILPVMFELGGDMVIGIVGDLNENYYPIANISDDNLRNDILKGIKKCIVDYML